AFTVGLSAHLALIAFFFSSRRRHTRSSRDWSSDVCSSDLDKTPIVALAHQRVIEAWQNARRIVAENENLLRVREEVEDARLRWRSEERRGGKEWQAGRVLDHGQKKARASTRNKSKWQERLQ